MLIVDIKLGHWRKDHNRWVVLRQYANQSTHPLCRGLLSDAIVQLQTSRRFVWCSTNQPSPISRSFPAGNFRIPFPASVRANTRVPSSWCGRSASGTPAHSTAPRSSPGRGIIYFSGSKIFFSRCKRINIIMVSKFIILCKYKCLRRISS